MIACLCTGMYRCMLLVVKVENKSLWIRLLCFPKTSHPPPDLAFSQTLQFFLPFSTALLAFHHYFIVLILRPHHFLPHAASPVVSARYHVVTLWYSSKLCPFTLVIIMHENENNLYSVFGVDFSS